MGEYTIMLLLCKSAAMPQKGNKQPLNYIFSDRLYHTNIETDNSSKDTFCTYHWQYLKCVFISLVGKYIKHII